MHENQLNDLRQFIAATVSQSEQRIKDELTHEIKKEVNGVRKEIRTELGELRTEMRDGFAGVGEAIEEIHKQNHELDVRIAKLERQAA